jgi:hypothetical protein
LLEGQRSSDNAVPHRKTALRRRQIREPGDGLIKERIVWNGNDKPSIRTILDANSVADLRNPLEGLLDPALR